MPREWTKEQEDAIRARGGALLVSAAAGSGKTAVLVQRFIERITDPEHPVDADRMLVVTFTKAAAGEMRERILAQLNAMIAADPSNIALRRQKLCLARAHISTVHSFCSDLLREFFNQLGIAPDFRIADDKEVETLQHAACDELLEEVYRDPSFESFAEAFSGERDDGPLSQTILALYAFTRSHPFPDAWLEEKLHLYEDVQRAEDTVWGQTLLEDAADVLRGAIDMQQTACRIAEEDAKLADALMPAYDEDERILRSLLTLCEEKKWDELGQALAGAKFPTARAPRGYADDPLKVRATKIRDAMKKAVKELAKNFVTDSAACAEECTRMLPYVRRLIDLVRRFSQLYDAKKKEKDVLDFGDLEHLTLRLLYRQLPSGEWEATETAKTVSARFDEVMVDEYQDTNEAQDSLFAAVAGLSNHRFMVGDVKQSIYGFRQAMPAIFLRYQKTFEPYSRENPVFPACVTLDRNFRSRRDVTESVNYIFSQLMREEVGDVSYTGGQRLVAQATYPEGSDTRTELAVLPRVRGASYEEAEARWIARRIRQMLDEGFCVTDHGELHPATPGDFCILLRSTTKTAPIYARVLAAEGIAARASLTGSFFKTAEIRLALSFLRVIDNPAQDIPLLAVLMSPVYGFSPDDVAKMRLELRAQPLIVTLTQRAETDEPCRRVLDDLARWRRLASTMTSEMFLHDLFEKTGLEDLVLAMENGTVRLENLRLLRQYAASYEASGYHGIGAFLHFLDQLAERKGDLAAADPQAELADAVQIMSIHKSKGLEFPVCIVAGCGRQFVRDYDDVVVHPELGIGMRLLDPSVRARYTTLPRDAILIRQQANNLSEEMRVLYVALTRAREKLILVGSVRDREKTLENLAARLGGEEAISTYAVRSARSLLDWLLLCALRHPDGYALRQAGGAGNEIVFQNEAPSWLVSLPDWPDEAQAANENSQPFAPADEAFLHQVREAVSFVYPWEGINTLPSKVAVTALAEARTPGEYPLAAPSFLQANEMTAAERGTAVHAFLQFLDLRIDPAQLSAECSRLVERRFITERQLSAVELPAIARLLTSRLGERIRNSTRVLREYRFSVPIPARAVDPSVDDRFADEAVVLQGAVDCLFEEDGKLFIVDFKTDRVKNMDQLREKYAAQLELYALAVARTLECSVGGKVLYSLHLGEEINV